MPHRGIKPASATCQSDALPTELHPRMLSFSFFSFFFFFFFLSGVSVCLYFTLTTTSSVKHLHLDFLSCSVKKNSILNLFYVWCAVQMCLCINCATCTWSVTAPEVVLVMHTMYRKCLLPFSCWLATLWH